MTTVPLLLDTHVWIWVMEGDGRRLRPDAVDRIDAAAAEGALRVHALSVWEIGSLVRRGRLSLSVPVARWVDDALAVPGMTLVPLTAAIALDAARLDDAFPGDPVDRILVATARAVGAALVTCDRRILGAAEQMPEAPLVFDPGR